MIDERFSLEAFQKCGRDSEAARDLADQLQSEVEREFHATLETAFGEIVAELNGLGHDLTIVGTEPGDIAAASYNAQDEVEMRLDVDTIAAAGFAHFESESPDA